MFEDYAPGAHLAQALATVERESLSGEELVELMQAHHRQMSHYAAEFYVDVRAVAEAVAAVDPELGYEYVPDEIATALSWTRRRAETDFGFAWELGDFPQVALALWAGRIDPAKAKTIVLGLTGIDRGLAVMVADQLLEKAETQTTGQLRARLAKLLLTIDPSAATERYRAGLRERKLILDSNNDGTANLRLYHLPPDQAALAFDRIEGYARALATAEEPRNLDQLRADVGLDLLIGCLEHAEGGKRPIVDLRVELTTLLELDQKPGEIPGFGPIISDLARQLAEQHRSEWRFHVVDEGRIVAEGTTRRRPSRPQRRRIETRYPHCVFPGCRTPSIHADLDHRKRWVDGGATEDLNLTPLCRHNHGAKDEGGWRVEMVDPYTFKWISPLGLKYLVEIEPP